VTFRYASAFLRFHPVFLKYRPYTMVSRLRYLENLALAEPALRAPALKQAAVIECGIWKGGMAAGLIAAGGPSRDYLFFDSFEGMPPVEEVDGAKAKAYQTNTTAHNYHDNCRAALSEFEALMTSTKCPPERIRIVPGFFEKSFPSVAPPPIAVLRLDAD
jgi:hypothetical protein